MQRVRSQFVNAAADDDDNRPLELKSTLISAIKSECLSDRDAGFCSGGDDTDLDTELFRSPSSNSRDSSCIDTKQTDDHNRGRRRSDDSIFSRISSRSSSSGHSSCSSISNNNNNTTATTSTTTKRKSAQPLRLLTDGQLAVKRRIVNVEKSPVEVRLIKTEPILSDDIVAADNDSKRTVVSPFRPWSNSSAGRTNGSSSKPVVSRTDDDHRMLIDHYHPVEVPSGYLPVPYLHRNHLRSSTAYNNDDTTNSNAADDDDNINNVQSEPLSLVVVKKNKDMEIPTFKQEDSGTSRSSLTGDSFTFTNPSFNININSSSNSRPLKVDRKAIAKDMVVVVKEEITDDDNNFYHPGCDREDDETVVVDNIQKKEQTVEESSQKQPTDKLGDDTDIAHRRLNNQQQQRNYKNMTRERRIEANARERTRVHTISAAFDNLRQSVPSYANDQKLSKLSVLRIACAYISTLSRLAGHDYTADQSVPSVADCVDNVCNTIQLEGKTRKKKDD